MKKRTKTQLLRIKNADPLIKWILKKIYVDRENCIIKILGKIQKGKSTIAMEIAWRLLPFIFSIESIVWNPEEVSNFYDNIRRGDVMVYEEVGTESGGLPRRRWYEFNNILILDLMQTHGFEGTVCILTLPSSKYIDSATEPLIDIQIEAKKIDRRNRVNIFTAYWCEWDEGTEILYKHCFLDENGEKIEVFAFQRTIPKELIKDYKKAERKFKKWIQKRVGEEIRKKQITEEETDKMFDEMKTRVVDFLVNRHNRLYVSLPLIEDEFKIGNRVARRLKLRLEKLLLTDDKYLALRESIASNLIIDKQEILDVSKENT